MKILSVNKFFWNKGGSETVFFNEKALLEKDGHTVIPFSMKSDENFDSPYSRYFVEYIDYSSPSLLAKIKNASKIIYSFDAKDKMRELLKVDSPDVAHFHIFQHQISPSVFNPLRQHGVPILLTLHDLKPMCPNYTMYTKAQVCEKCKGGKFYNAILNKCTKNSGFGSTINALEMYFHKAMGYYQQVDKFIAVSRFYLEKMVEFGFPREKLVYLPNAVNADKFTKARSVSDYALYFGRLSEEKGVQTFIEAASHNPSVNHKIVGTGPSLELLENFIKNNKVKNVEILGFKSGEDLKKLIREALVVVVPSVWFENCPMTILESFASSRPVIGADIGGITELINHEYDGFLFKPNDALQLSNYISYFHDNPDSANLFGERGRSKVKEEFNEKVHLEKLLEVYTSLKRS